MIITKYFLCFYAISNFLKDFEKKKVVNVWQFSK